MRANRLRLLRVLIVATWSVLAVSARAQQAPANLALVDINSAAKHVLEGLPGIREAEADAIIKARPYKNKDDLLRKKIVPPETYERIKGRIIASEL